MEALAHCGGTQPVTLLKSQLNLRLMKIKMMASLRSVNVNLTKNEQKAIKQIFIYFEKKKNTSAGRSWLKWCGSSTTG